MYIAKVANAECMINLFNPLFGYSNIFFTGSCFSNTSSYYFPMFFQISVLSLHFYIFSVFSTIPLLVFYVFLIFCSLTLFLYLFCIFYGCSVFNSFVLNIFILSAVTIGAPNVVELRKLLAQLHLTKPASQPWIDQRDMHARRFSVIDDTIGGGGIRNEKEMRNIEITRGVCSPPDCFFFLVVVRW